MGYLTGEKADNASAYEEYAMDGGGKEVEVLPPSRPTAGTYFEALGKLADCGKLDGWSTDFVDSMISRGPDYKCSPKQEAVIKKLAKEYL